MKKKNSENKQENLAEEKRNQLEQDVREMAQKVAELSKQCQKEIDFQTAKQVQLEENARAAKLGKDEAKQCQIAEMDRLMEVINRKSGNVKSTPMIKVLQPCPCCNAEKHHVTVGDCMKTVREKRNKCKARQENTMHYVCVRPLMKRSLIVKNGKVIMA